jgi:hypothetical protein
MVMRFHAKKNRTAALSSDSLSILRGPMTQGSRVAGSNPVHRPSSGRRKLNGEQRSPWSPPRPRAVSDGPKAVGYPHLEMRGFKSHGSKGRQPDPIAIPRPSPSAFAGPQSIAYHWRSGSLVRIQPGQPASRPVAQLAEHERNRHHSSSILVTAGRCRIVTGRWGEAVQVRTARRRASSLDLAPLVRLSLSPGRSSFVTSRTGRGCQALHEAATPRPVSSRRHLPMLQSIPAPEEAAAKWCGFRGERPRASLH